MALTLPNWLSLSQSSGSGNSTIQVSATPNHGRSARNFTLLYKALNCGTKNQIITQNGAAAFVTVEQSTITLANDTTSLLIKGTSNCKRLFIELGTGSDNFLTIPTHYTANGTQASNQNAPAAAISNDPGATIGFEWSINITVTPNQAQTIKQRQITVMGVVDPDTQGGTTITTYATVDVTQSASPAQLSISPASIEFAAATNLSRNVTVTSNTDWYIEG